MRKMKSAALVLVALLVLASGLHAARADSGPVLVQKANKALKDLYRTNSAAKLLGEKAHAVLVFPHIVKAGLIIGGQGGDGVLFKGGKPSGYYRSLAVSYGLQAGGQAFGYALFFMNAAALGYLDKSDGWEIGTGPSIVVVDAGFAKSLTTTTLHDDVYAFIFDQRGLMAGIGIQGSKITKIHPGE